MSQDRIQNHPWPKGESPLARTLRRMLDESNLFTRDQWAEFFGKNKREFEAWVNDEKFPNATDLRMLHGVLTDCTGIPETIISEFESLLDQPLADITPLAGKMLARLQICESAHSWLPMVRLREYYLLPVLAGFLRTLFCHGYKDQEKTLFDAAQEIRKTPNNFGGI